MHRTSLFPAAIAAALIAAASLSATTTTTTVNWDELATGSYMETPLGYGGLNWFVEDGSFGAGNNLQYTSLGAYYSASNAAYNAWGDTPLRIESLTTASGDTFTLSAFLSGQPFPGWEDYSTGAAKIQVEGFLGDSTAPVFTSIITLPRDGSWLHVDFNSIPVNKLLISPRKNDDTPSDYLGGYVFLDDATVTTSAIPEPQTYAGILGLLTLGLVAWHRRRTA